MKRKSLALPAVAALLTSALTACGGPDGSGAGDGAIVLGSTDRIEASKAAPAPLDPARPTTSPHGACCTIASRR